jgi:hypothetical protein
MGFYLSASSQVNILGFPGFLTMVLTLSKLELLFTLSLLLGGAIYFVLNLPKRQELLIMIGGRLG